VLRESGPAGISIRDLSVASPVPFRHATSYCGLASRDPNDLICWEMSFDWKYVYELCVCVSRDLIQLTYLGAGENNLTSLPREIGQSPSSCWHECPLMNWPFVTLSVGTNPVHGESTWCIKVDFESAQFHRKFTWFETFSNVTSSISVWKYVWILCVHMNVSWWNAFWFWCASFLWHICSTSMYVFSQW